jgi:hypothetical protein
MTMPQSHHLPVVGYQQLPKEIRESKILSANFIGALSGLKKLPTREEAEQYLTEKIGAVQGQRDEIHSLAMDYFIQGNVEMASHLVVFDSFTNV